jgi:hypothetical protein
MTSGIRGATRARGLLTRCDRGREAGHQCSAARDAQIPIVTVDGAVDPVDAKFAASFSPLSA